jgi:hypothetical protein
MRAVFRDDCLNRRYAEQGYLVLPLLSAPEVSQLTEAFDRLHQGELAPFHATVRHKDESHRRAVYAAIYDICDPKLSTLLDEYKVCIANFVVKLPMQQQSRVPMHVDWSFVDERRFPSVNIWCPLVDVDAGNGCLEVVPSSEHHNVLLRPYEGDMLGPHPFHDVLFLLQNEYAQKIELLAGEAIFYNGRLLHGSGPNLSDKRRVAVGCAAVPVEAAIWHSGLVSPTQAETFEVGREFFWSYQLGERPTGVRSLGISDYSVHQMNESDVLNSPHLRKRGPR